MGMRRGGVRDRGARGARRGHFPGRLGRAGRRRARERVPRQVASARVCWRRGGPRSAGRGVVFGFVSGGLGGPASLRPPSSPGPRPRPATAPSILCSVPAALSSLLHAGPRLLGSTPLGNGRPTLGASLSPLCGRPASPARPSGVGGGGGGVEGTFPNAEPLTLRSLALHRRGGDGGCQGLPIPRLCLLPLLLL